MTNYNNPWREKEQRAKAAIKVRDEMQQRFPNDIQRCVQTTAVMGESSYLQEVPAGEYAQTLKRGIQKKTGIEVVNLDTVSAAYRERGLKIAVLNFASYKNPGGMFLEGSIAQEESLCHESALYNILSDEHIVQGFYFPNRQNLNRSLYHSHLLYTIAVPFVHNGEFKYLDVITCAAPNKGAAQKYCHVSGQECDYAMRLRIRSVLMAAIDRDVDVLILGAFGCGVFRNDPKTVATIFKQELDGCPFKAVFAVPGDKYTVFKTILEKVEEKDICKDLLSHTTARTGVPSRRMNRF